MIKNKNNKKQTKDPNAFYKIIDDIRFKKEGNLLESQENLAAFNNFMALRYLSMDRNNISIVNILNQFQGVLDKKSLYEILVDVIPPQKNYIKYISNKKKEHEYIPFVCEYYQCSPKEAKEYIDLKGEDWAKELVNKFGGKDINKN